MLDNGPVHTSKASKTALAERAHWLRAEWLPGYPPELNAIETVWRDLKAHGLTHQTFTDLDRLDRAIQDNVADWNNRRNWHPLDSLRIPAQGLYRHPNFNSP